MSYIIDLTPLKKAVDSLEEILNCPRDTSKQSQFIRDGAIQRFEYTYELCWKMLRRVLVQGYNTIESLPIKDLYREAAKFKIIESPEKWFEYHLARNLTSHIYAEEITEKTYRVAQDFLPDARILLKNLGTLINDTTQ